MTMIYFNRPGDWIPSISRMPLFQLTILPCLALSMGLCFRHLNSLTLRKTPISICVSGTFVVVLISQLAHTPNAIDIIISFGKACIYYLLIVSIVDSAWRINFFLKCLGVSIFFIGLLMVLNHHTSLFGDGISASSIANGRTGALGGANFDANDTASLLVLSVLIFLHYAVEATKKTHRIIWVMLLVVSVYGIQLTDSRAGFLALLLGCSAYVWCRWGKRGIKWGIVIMPLAILLIASQRMTDFHAVIEGTGQSRLQFWSQGLSCFFRNPILGIGPEEFAKRVGMPCHNSFIQAYAELGFIGGTFFLGAFYLGIGYAYRLSRTYYYERLVDFQVDCTIHLVVALLLAYFISILTLNPLYGSHTYILLGVATSTISIYAVEESDLQALQNKKIILQSIAISCLFLVFTYLATQLLVSW